MPVRQARIEDLAAVARLYVVLKNHHRELQPFNPRYQVDDHRWEVIARGALEDDNVTVFVAESEGTVRGFVKLSLVEKPWGVSCEMDTLVVDEDWRGRGIGRSLLSAAEEYAVEAGAKGLRADVLITNEEGRAFYEREGYVSIAVRYGKTIQPARNERR